MFFDFIKKNVHSRQKSVLIGLVFLLLWEAIAFPKVLNFLPIPVFATIATFLLVATVFWIKHLSLKEIFSEKVIGFFDFLILPLILSLGATLYIYLTPSLAIQQGVIFMSFFFLIFSLATMNVDKRGSLVSYNIFIAATILAVWFSYWTIYYLTFYIISSFFLIPLILITTLLLLHQLFFSLGKIEDKSYWGLPNLTFWYYIGTFSLVILEVSIALIFWPTMPFIKAFILLLVFFLMWEITWHYFSGKLTKKVLLEYAGIIGIIFLVLARAVQWYPI